MRTILETKQTARARVRDMLVGATTRNAVVIAAIAAVVTRRALTTIDAATFGLFNEAAGNDVCSITAGAKALTSPDLPWTAADVGKRIDIAGAGAAGGTLRTVIAAYVSAGSITVRDAALTTVAATVTSAGGLAVWGYPPALTLKSQTLQNTAGASLHSLTPGVTGGVGRQAGTILGDMVYLEDYDLSGGTDYTLALEAVLAKPGALVVLPAKVIPFTRNLNAVCAGIIGSGWNASILTPSAAVTRALSMTCGDGSVTNPSILRDFQIDGVNTTSAKGIVFCDDTAGGGYAMATVAERVLVQHFHGANAVGIVFANILESSFYDLRLQLCTTDALVSGLNGLPTTLNFIGCQFRTAETVGVHVLTSAYMVTFRNCIFEGNTQEGAKLTGVTGNIIGIHFHECWFEGNYGNDNTKYQITAGDATAGNTIRVTVKNCYFAQAANSAKPMHFTGNGTQLVLESNTFGANIAASVLVDGGAAGTVPSWFPVNSFASEVSDSNNYVGNIDGDWRSYTPTLTADVGSAFAATTIVSAKYKTTGSLLIIQLNFTGTLNAVTPAHIYASLPAHLAINGEVLSPAVIKNDATYETGIVKASSGDNQKVDFSRANFAAWGSGKAFQCSAILVLDVFAF